MGNEKYVQNIVGESLCIIIDLEISSENEWEVKTGSGLCLMSGFVVLSVLNPHVLLPESKF